MVKPRDIAGKAEEEEEELPVYRRKYLQQIKFLNKIEPVSVQSLQELVFELKIVTTDTGKLRVDPLISSDLQGQELTL